MIEKHLNLYVRSGNSYEGKNVKLGISLDFKSSKPYVEADREDYLNYGYNGNLKQCLTNGAGFISIGETTRGSNGKANYFAGNFDGDNKIINNLYMNVNNESDSKNYYLALFGYRIDGKIENAYNVGKIFFDCTDSQIKLGGLVGYHGGDIENSYNIGKVECTKDFINGNLVNKLNKTEHTWKQGKSYPILDWE